MDPILTITSESATPRTTIPLAARYLDLLKKPLAFLNAAKAPVKERSHKIKVDIRGAAVRMQG